MANTTEVGSVVSLWRYPVKSMMGEELNCTEVTERGLLGDRAYALLDSSTGKVASAKFPKKWPNLFDFRAAFTEQPRTAENPPPVSITLPNGTILTSKQGELNRLLTGALGRDVKLATTASAPKQLGLEEYWPDMEGLAHRDTVTDEAMPEGTFFDLAVTHVLTTATIDRLRDLYPQGRFEVRRFRPNFVIQPSSGENGFVENGWIGHRISIGEEVRLEITGHCGRCVMTTLAQGDLPKDPGILRTAALHNGVRVGVYASVVHGGTVHRGDPVRLES